MVSRIQKILGDRIQANTFLIVLSFAAVLGLGSQSAASYPSYLLAIVMLGSIFRWGDVFDVRLTWSILAFLGYLCLSSLWSDPLGIRELTGIVVRALLVLLFVIAMAETQLRGLVQRWLGRALAIVGAIAAAASIAAHQIRGVEGARLSGLGQLDNPVVAGLVFGAVLILVLDVLLSDRHRSWRLAAGLGALIVVSAVVMTGSRNAWGSTVAGAVVLICASRIPDRQKFLVLLASLAVIGSATLAAVLASDELSSWLFPKGDSYRFQIWSTVLHNLNGVEWVFGRGILTPDGLEVAGYSLSHPHSMYLAVLVQGGLIAVSIFAVLVIWTLGILLDGYGQRSARLGLGIIAMALTSYLFDGHEIIDKVGETWFLFWLPVAIALGLSWSQTLGGERLTDDGSSEWWFKPGNQTPTAVGPGAIEN